MALFEIHERFKGYFLNKLRVSFKKIKFPFGWHLHIDQKSIECKKRRRRKTDSNFFVLSCQISHEVLRRRNVVHIVEFSLH